MRARENASVLLGFTRAPDEAEDEDEDEYYLTRLDSDVTSSIHCAVPAPKQ